MTDKQLLPEGSNEASDADQWRRLWWLPCELSLEISLARFTVRELLRLHPGSIVSSAWSRSAEIPLHVDGQLIGWAEFDALDTRIAARITELV